MWRARAPARYRAAAPDSGRSFLQGEAPEGEQGIVRLVGDVPRAGIVALQVWFRTRPIDAPIDDLVNERVADADHTRGGVANEEEEVGLARLERRVLVVDEELALEGMGELDDIHGGGAGRERAGDRERTPGAVLEKIAHDQASGEFAEAVRARDELAIVQLHRG